MNKQIIIVGIMLMLLTAGLSGCTSDDGDNGQTYPPLEPKAYIKVSDTTTRTGYEGIDYCLYIDVIVKNYGDAPGNAEVWAEVNQDSNQYEKRQRVYLDPNESDSITFKFCEFSYWSSDTGSWRVWVE